MNAFQYKNFHRMYEDVVRRLRKQSVINGTKELTNVMITVDDVTDFVINDRGISIPYLCGELLWYVRGSNRVEFISKFAKKWSEISDDGETSNSAYGYILSAKHGFNQFTRIKDLFRADINTRRAVLNFNVPNKNVVATKDEICTIALQFIVRDNKLHCTTMMRSNDVYTGMPYDIAFFVSLQKILAKTLKIECGTYTHFVTSLHLYVENEEKLVEALDKKHPKIIINATNLYKLSEKDYNDIKNSECPKEDVVKLFKRRQILEVIE